MRRVTIHPLCVPTGRLSGIPADEALIKRLRSSFEVMAKEPGALTDRFYATLFERAPAVRSLFPADLKAQKIKLFATLALIVEHLRSPQLVRTRLEQLGRAHVGYGAKPEHYPIVRDSLVAAMASVSGPAWTTELNADWTLAIDLIAGIMLGTAAGAGPAGAGGLGGTRTGEATGSRHG